MQQERNACKKKAKPCGKIIREIMVAGNQVHLVHFASNFRLNVVA